MAVKQLGRWRTSDPVHPIGAKPGAFTRPLVADAAPPRRESVHIHLHGRTYDQAAPRRTPVRDEPMTTEGLPEVRRSQTTEPPAAGFRGESVDLRGRNQLGRRWDMWSMGRGKSMSSFPP